MNWNIVHDRRSLLTPSSLKTADPTGRIIFFPDVKSYLRRAHAKAWGSDATEVQSESNFRFPPEIFTAYLRHIGMRPRDVYFPFAYTGKVAKAISEAGFSVLASDLSEYWVRHLRQLGLNAEQRSFEDHPPRRFDAVVSFEPLFADGHLLGYLGLLAVLSRNQPFIRIFSDRSGGLQRLGITPETPMVLTAAGCGEIARNGSPYVPEQVEKMDRIAYDYGIRVQRHSVLLGETGFDFSVIMPPGAAHACAELDLHILLKCHELENNSKISIQHVAKVMQLTEEAVALAFLRIGAVLNIRFFYEHAYRTGEKRFLDQPEMLPGIHPVEIIA